jgi:peptidyl-prolyl cis-trans isomerase C
LQVQVGASYLWQLQIWVQQELLAQEALQRGVDRRPDLQRQLEMWYQSILAQAMKQYVQKHAIVTGAEVWSYMQSKDQQVAIPKVQIRELQTASLEDMSEALTGLQHGRSFEEMIERWSNNPELKARMGLSDPFPISERSPVGEIAWQMDVGQRYGLLKVSRGYLYFELVAKHSQKLAGDSTDAAGRDQAKGGLQRMKQRRMMNLFLAQVGQRRGFNIYQDRLNRINVSPIPMMTFRILGFGGRMFAVPFLDRQIEWINVEPPSGIIFP